MTRLLVLLAMYTQLHAITAKEVYAIAMQYTNYPSTIVAMARVESTLGKHILGDDGKSLGLLQWQVASARWIATKDDRLSFIEGLTDKELETLLLRSDTVSIMLTCIQFEYYRERYGYFVAISKHNGGFNNHAYYNRVREAMRR